MNSNLNRTADLWRGISTVLLVLVIILAALLWQQIQRLRQYQRAELITLTQAHQRQQDMEILCAAVADQEYIIRRELPMVKMSWKKDFVEVCR